jgi:hypothetical protein
VRNGPYTYRCFTTIALDLTQLWRHSDTILCCNHENRCLTNQDGHWVTHIPWNNVDASKTRWKHTKEIKILRNAEICTKFNKHWKGDISNKRQMFPLHKPVYAYRQKSWHNTQEVDNDRPPQCFSMSLARPYPTKTSLPPRYLKSWTTKVQLISGSNNFKQKYKQIPELYEVNVKIHHTTITFLVIINIKQGSRMASRKKIVVLNTLYMLYQYYTQTNFVKY